MASTDISLFAYEAAEPKKEKSATALRTISEAAEILDVPQHVLRFWETKFTQIKPLKRNGGRRFYRPQDIDVLQQIKHLLYNQGYTIKGAKKAVEEFVHARAERGVSSSEWIAAIPPASVNDNFMPALVIPLEAAEPMLSEDPLADIADALSDDMLVAAAQDEAPAAPAISRMMLLNLRDELLAMRDSLRGRLPEAAPVYQ